MRRYRPDVMTTYNAFGGYGHPDHLRTHLVAVGAFERAGDPTCYPEQLEGGEASGGVELWSPAKVYEQAIPASVRIKMNERMAAAGMRSFWMPAEDATPEQVAEHEAFLEKALVPDELVTTRIDVNDFLHTKLAAIQRHVTQISTEHPFMRFGVEGWREFGGIEAFVLRASRVPTELPETDLFAGL